MLERTVAAINLIGSYLFVAGAISNLVGVPDIIVTSLYVVCSACYATASTMHFITAKPKDNTLEP